MTDVSIYLIHSIKAEYPITWFIVLSHLPWQALPLWDKPCTTTRNLVVPMACSKGWEDEWSEIKSKEYELFGHHHHPYLSRKRKAHFQHLTAKNSMLSLAVACFFAMPSAPKWQSPTGIITCSDIHPCRSNWHCCINLCAADLGCCFIR